MRASLQTRETNTTPAPSGLLQRACACGQHTGGGECFACEEERRSLQRSTLNPENNTPKFNEVPPIVHEVLRSPGQSLDPATRAFFEPRFGHDFSGVRVHTDARAADSAAAIDSLAYTSGRNVVFQRGHYQPDTLEGKLVLAHELAHVIQQSGSISAPAGIGSAEDSSEHEADSIADSVIRGEQVQGVAVQSNRIQRWPYRVMPGDTLGRIAQRFNTTVDELRRLNNLPNTNIRVGQQIEVGPIAGCTLPFPTDRDTQILAGVIFAEAEGARATNDERETIAWAFLNSVQHTLSLCDGTICSQLNQRRRAAQCIIERRDLGDSILEAVRIGSTAYNGPRWNMVMSGNALLPLANLCLLSPPSEITALRNAINVAETVMISSVPPNNFVRLNRAANHPPSPRMERAGAVAGHTFYRFKAGRECG